MPLNQHYFCHKKITALATPRKSRKFFDRLTPVLPLFVASLPLFRAPLHAYATSAVALYAATLAARTIRPRKARREPTYANAYEASEFASALDTPPFAYA